MTEYQGITRVDILTALSPAEQLALVRWADEAAGQRSGNLLEIGAYLGASTVLLAGVAQERDCYVLSLDHHRGDAHAGHANTLQPYLDNLQKYGCLDRVVPLVASSNMVAVANCLSRRVAFAFVDALHTKEAVQHDVEFAFSLMRNSVVACHDYGLFEVEEAIEGLEDVEVVDQVETMVLLRKVKD